MSQTGRRLRQILVHLTEGVRRKAFGVTAFAIVFTAVAVAYTVSELKIDTSTTNMISPETPFRRNHIAFKKAFPQLSDIILVVIDSKTPEHAEDAALRFAERLRKNGSQFHSVRVAGADPFFGRHGLLFLEVEDLARLADRLASAEPLLAILGADPNLRGLADIMDMALKRAERGESTKLSNLLNRMTVVVLAEIEGRTLNFSWQSLLIGEAADKRRFVLVRPVLDHSLLKPAAGPLAEIRRIGKGLGISEKNNLRMRVTGAPAINLEELERVEIGGKNSSLLSLLLVSLLLVLGLRSVRLVIAAAATLLIGLAWTGAFATLFIGRLNLISVTFAVLFIGLGVDFGIHMCLRYREEAEGGASHAEALAKAADRAGGALSLSAVSAAAGFYSFLPTNYLGLAELGLIAGTGMFIALITNLTVLPALLSLFPPRIRFAPKVVVTSPFAQLLSRFGGVTFAGAIILGLAGAAAIPSLRFDFNPLNLKDPGAESVATFLDLARDPKTSPYTIDLLADSQEAARRLASRLQALPEVKSAITLLNFVPKKQEEKIRIIDDMAIFLSQALNPPRKPPLNAKARRAAFNRLRERFAAHGGKNNPLEAAAARLALALGRLGGGKEPTSPTLENIEHRLTAYLPQLFSRLRIALLAGPLTPANLPAGLQNLWLSKSGAARIEVRPAGGIAGNKDLRRFSEAVLRVAPGATGVPVIITEAGTEVVAAFKEATLVALVLIAGILFFVLRKPGEIALVLAPLLLSALWTAGASVLFDLPFNFANIIVLPLLLGLGVSSGIHLVLRHREEGEGERVLASSTPRGVLFSGLTTIAAFGSLSFSGHRGMSSMGQLLALSITFTLLATLIVLPSYMAWRNRRRPHR